MNTMIQTVVAQVLVPVLVAGLVWATKNFIDFLWAKVQAIKITWLVALADKAVLYAEDKYGPSTDNGAAKAQAAAVWLASMSKGYITVEEASKLVMAAYQGLFGELAVVSKPKV
jgi:hypothetical protein